MRLALWDSTDQQWPNLCDKNMRGDNFFLDSRTKEYPCRRTPFRNNL